MNVKLLTTAMALTFATAMAPAFGQSGGGNSDGGGQQGIGAVNAAEKNAPSATVAENRFHNNRMFSRSREYYEPMSGFYEPMNRESANHSGIEENHLLNVEQK